MKSYSFRLPPDLMEKVDEVRGDVSRTRFVVRALEALEDEWRCAKVAREADNGRPPTEQIAEAQVAVNEARRQRYGPRVPRPKGIA